MTLNDLERHNGRYFVLFHRNSGVNYVAEVRFVFLTVCDKICSKNDLFSGYNMILAIFPEITEEEGPLHQREFDLCNIARPSQQ